MTDATPKSNSQTLIVLHGNRYIEVYSNEQHAVKIVNVPNHTSIQGELLIEEMLTLRLPPVWSKVYTDGFLVNRDAIKDISAVDIVRRDNDLALIRTMNRIIETGVSPCTV